LSTVYIAYLQQLGLLGYRSDQDHRQQWRR